MGSIVLGVDRKWSNGYLRDLDSELGQDLKRVWIKRRLDELVERLGHGLQQR